MIISSVRHDVQTVAKSQFEVRMILTIRNLQKHDVGTYRCAAKNSLGDVESSIRLYGEYTARFRPVIKVSRGAHKEYLIRLHDGTQSKRAEFRYPPLHFVSMHVYIFPTFLPAAKPLLLHHFFSTPSALPSTLFDIRKRRGLRIRNREIKPADRPDNCTGVALGDEKFAPANCE